MIVVYSINNNQNLLFLSNFLTYCGIDLVKHQKPIFKIKFQINDKSILIYKKY